MIRRIEASAVLALLTGILVIAATVIWRAAVWLLSPEGFVWLLLAMVAVFVLSFALDAITGGGLSGDE
jgi:hypothetical protein